MSTNTTAEQFRQSAADHEAAAQESFDRCDTDGFLSQWAHGICADRDRLAAQVADNGGLWQFPALFDLGGNLVAAKLIPVQSKFHAGKDLMWGILENDDPGSRVTGWIKAHPARQSTMERKGYREGTIEAPASAVIQGSGRGLSGRAWACVVRKDRGFSRNVRIVDNGSAEK